MSEQPIRAFVQVDERGGLPSASGGDKFYNCAGSRILEREAPLGEPTAEAVEGEAIHEAMKEQSAEGLDEEGRNIQQRLTAMEQEAIQEWAIERELDREALKTVPVNREVRCWVRDRNTLSPACSAQLDCYLIVGDGAIANDYKTGFLETPPARQNIQMRIQAVALWHENPELKHIRVCVSRYRFKGKYDHCDYDLQDLIRAEQELFFRLWLLDQSHAPRVPGPWCKYCRAKGFCPENGAFALLPMAATQLRHPSKTEITETVAHLDLPSLAYIRHHQQQIKDTLEAVGKRLKSYSNEQLNPVGLQLVPSDGVRTLPDIDKVWTVMFNEGISADDFRKRVCKATVGAAETLLVEKLIADANTRGETLTEKAAKIIAAQKLKPAVKMDPRDPTLKSL